MKKFFINSLFFLLTILSANAQTVKGYPVAIGSSIVGPLWNPSDKGADVALSNGNATATYSGTNATEGARSTVSHSTGLQYFEQTAGGAAGNNTIGIANATESLTNFLGADTNGVGYFASGSVSINGVNIGPVQTYSAGDDIAWAFDFTHSKVWIKNLTTASGWNNDVIANQNPATNTGGLSLSTLAAGPYFVAVVFNNLANNSSVLKNSGNLLGTIPVGFVMWQ